MRSHFLCLNTRSQYPSAPVFGLQGGAALSEEEAAAEKRQECTRFPVGHLRVGGEGGACLQVGTRSHATYNGCTHRLLKRMRAFVSCLWRFGNSVWCTAGSNRAWAFAHRTAISNQT